MDIRHSKKLEAIFQKICQIDEKVFDKFMSTIPNNFVISHDFITTDDLHSTICEGIKLIDQAIKVNKPIYYANGYYSSDGHAIAYFVGELSELEVKLNDFLKVALLENCETIKQQKINKLEELKSEMKILSEEIIKDEKKFKEIKSLYCNEKEINNVKK